MKSTWKLRASEPRRLTLTKLTLAATGSLAIALGVSACQNVAGFTQPSLVRVIDASYIAPAINVTVEGTLLAGNIGQGTITPYGTVAASPNAQVKVMAADSGSATTASSALVSTDVTLLAGHQHSIFLTDNGAAPKSYTVTVLEDQQVAAASGHSAFRFLNQAPKVGAVDIYMVPANSTLANTVPLVTALPVGGTAGYISFTSQTVGMVIVPTGTQPTAPSTTSMALTGGEVRTVLIVDTQLTSNPPVEVFIASDLSE